MLGLRVLFSGVGVGCVKFASSKHVHNIIICDIDKFSS
jgi:hypothetical protein